MVRKWARLLPVLLGIFALLLAGDTGAQAARAALSLCAQTVIPSLFPFFVLSSLLIACGGSELLAGLLSPLMRPLFSLSGAGAAALALGLCGGYPVGARTAAELVSSGALLREEGERLLAFCNNAGPGFLLGICGGAVFRSPRIGAALYLIHVASALLSGIVLCHALPPLSRRERSLHPRAAPLPLSSALPAAVQSALSGILNVCAFVVFFSVLSQLLLCALPAQLLAPLPRALSRLSGADERHHGAPRLARRLSFLRGAPCLGRAERTFSVAQRACFLSAHGEILSARKAHAGAAFDPAFSSRAARSLSVIKNKSVSGIVRNAF